MEEEMMDKHGFYLGSMKSFMPIFEPSILEKNKNVFVMGKIGGGKKMRVDAPVKYFEDNPVSFQKGSCWAGYQLTDRNSK
jgi:hypothetical protein